jgi:NAD(P)-dependent dehydrogenase (short-subunit alcohol dehydrogenase family)
VSGERFGGKTCLVTGAAHGIGRATALAFAAEGAHVVIGDIDASGAEAVVAEIAASGGSAASRGTDVSQPDALRALVDFAREGRPTLDVVFANAAILDPAPIEELDDARFRRTLDTNLMHPFVLVREAAAALRESGGSVVITSSTGGLRGTIGEAAYCATKAGVINLTRVLAAELGPEVRVNCVCPGWVDTPFNDTIWEILGGREREPEFMARVPLGRQGRPEEIARAVLFLASEEASYVNAHALVVDGGMTSV